MSFNYKYVLALFTIGALFCCESPNNVKLDSLQSIHDSIKNIHAPDKRVAIFDISIAQEGNQIVLSGETDQKEALSDLLKTIKSKGYAVKNAVSALPDSSVGIFTRAIVNNSVANIRSQAKHSGELATQAILGTPLKVLKIAGDFYQVQTPDGYISWVDHGGVSLLSLEEYQNWADSPKVIFTRPYGFVYQEENHELKKVSDIVLGAQLKLLSTSDNYFKVEYPDKRTGFIKKEESELYASWISNVQPSGTLIELYAQELMGIPYLWGGTSSKGMDCSGFTKTVYLMNGFIIPRDASQQIMAGKDIDPNLAFEGLQKGDLMFFGKKATDSTRQRVTHVGIFLGNKEGQFIHASGKVKMGSINPSSSFYDEFNTNRYLGSRRYLGEKDKGIIDLKSSNEETEIKS